MDDIGENLNLTIAGKIIIGPQVNNLPQHSRLYTRIQAAPSYKRLQATYIPYFVPVYMRGVRAQMPDPPL